MLDVRSEVITPDDELFISEQFSNQVLEHADLNYVDGNAPCFDVVDDVVVDNIDHEEMLFFKSLLKKNNRTQQEQDALKWYFNHFKKVKHRRVSKGNVRKVNELGYTKAEFSNVKKKSKLKRQYDKKTMKKMQVYYNEKEKEQLQEKTKQEFYKELSIVNEKLKNYFANKTRELINQNKFVYKYDTQYNNLQKQINKNLEMFNLTKQEMYNQKVNYFTNLQNKLIKNRFSIESQYNSQFDSQELEDLQNEKARLYDLYDSAFTNDDDYDDLLKFNLNQYYNS